MPNAPDNLLTFSGIGLIPLPTTQVNTNLVGMMGTASGWGRYSDMSQSQSQFLKYVALPIVANTVCSSVYGTTVVRDTNLCTSTTATSGTCGGDSGGPLTANITGQNYVVGIVSFGAEAGCQLGYPAGFTRVTSYLDWIERTSMSPKSLIVNVLLMLTAQAFFLLK